MADLSNSEIIYKQESYNIVGAAIEVHKELGCGFHEAVYAEAFELELIRQGIPYLREAPLKIEYKEIELQKLYYADFICYGKIIVELKALNRLESLHNAQVLNYLKASKHKLGILLNFGEKSLKTKRIVL